MGRHSIPDPDEPSENPPYDTPEPQYGGDRESRDYYEYSDGYGDDSDDEFGSPDPRFDDTHVDDDDDGFDERSSDSRHSGPSGSAGDSFSRDFGDAYWTEERDRGRGTDPDAYADPAYPDPDPPTNAFARTGGSPSRPPSSKPQHGGDWDGGEWTGSHRAIQAGRRGVSKGVIAALVTVVVVVGAFILWRFVGDALSDRSQVAAARCVSGEVAVGVVADPSISDDIRGLADEFNQTAAPVGDKCVKIAVTAAESGQVIDGLTGDWAGDLGEKPALWIPGSSVSVARLEAVTGPETVSVARSLVTSPVMLAVRPELKTALAKENWAALPRLQSNPNGLDDLRLPGWGNLRLALPMSDDADASYVAAEAVAAGSAPAGAPATAGAGAVSTLVASQPDLADDTLAAALDGLLGDGPPAAAPVHAVATTEQQIFKRAASMPDAAGDLAAWLPAGPTALADYPAVQLAGEWLTREQVTAASEFDRYLRKPEALTRLVAAGFRADVDGASPPANDVVDFGDLAAPLTIDDAGARVALANALGAPAQSRTVTVMLDQSMDTVEAGRSRVANVTAALGERLRAVPSTAAVGLWTFDGVSGRSEVATGPLADPIDGRPRSQVLTDNLTGQVASGGGAVSFTTLRLVYTEAVANFREGQDNSVLVITAGPHTDQSLDGAGLEAFIAQNFTPARPVAVNVIDIGADPDRATWESVAQTTGGTYQNVPSSAGPELAAAIATALG